MSKLIAKLEFAVGVTLLAIITFLVFIAAVMRFFGHPLIWSIDLAQMLFIWLCFIGASRAMRERAHLGVDFLVRFLSHKYRLIVETVLTVLFITFLLILAVEGYKLTLLNMERLFGDSGLPYACVTIAVPVGCILLSLAMISNLLESWKASGRDGKLIYTRTATDGETRSEL